MAREDLDVSHHEESEFSRKRLATELVPGPRERLHRPRTIPLRDVRLPLNASQEARTQLAPIAGPSGERPRNAHPAMPARGQAFYGRAAGGLEESMPSCP